MADLEELASLSSQLTFERKAPSNLVKMRLCRMYGGLAPGNIMST